MNPHPNKIPGYATDPIHISVEPIRFNAIFPNTQRTPFGGFIITELPNAYNESSTDERDDARSSTISGTRPLEPNIRVV
jgi:hypothetical protein